MAATAIETIPATWDDDRDNAFFRITASLFSCEFTYGAGVLLASYDDDFDTTALTATEPVDASTTSPSATPTTASHATSR